MSGIRWTDEQYEAWKAKGNNRAAVPARGGSKLHPKWSQQEILELVHYYNFTSAKDFNIEDLAARLNRSVDAIIIKAGRIGGLTDTKRTASVRGKERMSISQNEVGKEVKAARAARLSGRRHPTPALGIVHSEATRKQIGDKLRERHKDPSAGWNTPEHRQYLSDKFSKTAGLRRSYTRSAGGRRANGRISPAFFRLQHRAGG